MILVLGILQDKAAEQILTEIIPLADRLIITRPNSPRAADPLYVKKIAGKLFNGQLLAIEDIPTALKTAYVLSSPGDLILIAGSLYLISEVRSLFFQTGTTFN